MPILSTPAAASLDAPATANDKLKRNWERHVWSATALGVVFHLGVLLYTPGMEVDVIESEMLAPAQLVRLVNLADIAVPPPPSLSALPIAALPDLAPLAFQLELAPVLDGTMQLPDFGEFDLSGQVLVPPGTVGDEWVDYRHFAPYVIRPEIRNRTELKRFLERSYQPIYEYSGDTGVVQVSFWINEGGLVEKAEIAKSSGSRSLDRLALRLSRVLRFRPAMMAGRPIRILVHVPITFRAA
jgi:TonB family protein